MKISERTLRISAASFIALLMMGASYLFSGPSFLNSRAVNAESTEELLKAYSSKDSDGDGLPDWQEALYGTDPNKAISNPFGILDGEAAKEGKLTPNALASQLPSAEATTTKLTSDDLPGVDPAPGSLTEQFSHEFLQDIVEASAGKPLDDATKQQIQQALFAKYTALAQQSFASNYTIISVHTQAGLSISDYAAGVESALKDNEVAQGEGDPISLMDSLINKNDATARPKLARLAKAYAAMRDQLLRTPAPPALANQHLELIQSLDSLSKATTAVLYYEKDPIAMLGGIGIYTPMFKKFIGALTGMGTAILAQGEPSAGQPGSYILAIVRLSQ
jgi:hypothetical protein